MTAERPVDIGLIEYWLGEWAYWMREGTDVGDVVVNDAPWRNARRAVNEDYEGVVEDQRLATIVDALDACIDSLPLHERAAVWRAYGFLAVFSFPRLVFEVTLAEAKQALGAAMRERGFPC